MPIFHWTRKDEYVLTFHSVMYYKKYRWQNTYFLLHILLQTKNIDAVFKYIFFLYIYCSINTTGENTRKNGKLFLSGLDSNTFFFIFPQLSNL